MLEYKTYYSPNLMVLGVFGGIGLIVWMATCTLITLDNIAHLVMLLSVAGTAFHYFKNGGGSKAFLHETIFFSICNWGLLGTGILLVINFLSAQPLPPKVHEVEEFKVQNRRISYIFTDGNPYKGFDYIIDYTKMDGRALEGEKLEFYFSQGILDLKIFEGVQEYTEGGAER